VKLLRKFAIVLGYAAVFLIAGATVCGLRAKYRSLPQMKLLAAYRYIGLVGDTSFLQYNQAGGEYRRAALLAYLQVIRKVQDEKIPYPQSVLHAETALTYLRLYRLDLAEDKSAEANNHLAIAQKELLSAGFKGDASLETLAKSIATREESEAKLYNNDSRASAETSDNRGRGSGLR
jgi:hypothetical protein